MGGGEEEGQKEWNATESLIGRGVLGLWGLELLAFI